MDTYKFYYDESEHSRKINYNTVTAPNYYDNFVTVVVGWAKEKEKEVFKKYEDFENKEELDPEYLMLWFSRPEFDRYARYKSHGSVREIFDWNELCMVELPVPDIEKRRKIVKAYKTITDRIALKQKINDNLAA